LAKKRGHTLDLIDGPHRNQREIGAYVEKCDVLVTTSPWWDYINMWVAAAKYFNKPWVYHPEGWDNCHPVIVPGEEGHAKNLGWPFKPDAICAHGPAMGRVLEERQQIDPKTLYYTGSPRFDIYGEYYDEIVDHNPFDPDKRNVLVCTSTLWNHDAIIEKLLENDTNHIIVRQHFTDPVELYRKYSKNHSNCNVLLPESVDWDSPERDHEYNPSIQDLVDYARQLYHADVVVNIAGTPTLEALMLGTPVVNVNKLPDDALPKDHGKIYGHYGPGAHYVDVKAGETSYVVSDIDDLLGAVETAMVVPFKKMDLDRKAAIDYMLSDILSINFTPHLSENPDGWGRPSNRAMNHIMTVIEQQGQFGR
jgi:hypothetical protein